MRKILLCLCFVFAVGLLFSACGKDDNKQNPNTPAPTQEETTMPPIPEDKQMSNEEQEAINSSNPETPLPAGLTIFQLCFGSDSIETGTNAEYTVVNNANYSFVFGLKDGEGNIMYKTIDAANVTFDFVSDNNAVSETNRGFSTSSQFYSDTNANITVTIHFKGLEEAFHFVLKSNKDKPATPTPNPEPTPDPTPTYPITEPSTAIIDGKTIELSVAISAAMRQYEGIWWKMNADNSITFKIAGDNPLFARTSEVWFGLEITLKIDEITYTLSVDEPNSNSMRHNLLASPSIPGGASEIIIDGEWHGRPNSPAQNGDWEKDWISVIKLFGRDISDGVLYKDFIIRFADSL